MCEILAPAGNKQNLITAISAGANAVYLGLKDFSARKTAENFSIEDLKYACAYAKTFGVKVYVTVNTLIKDGEINDFLSLINQAYACGVDAFILQDLFLGKLVKEKMPDVTLHLSTQAGVCNEYGAIQAKNYGFSRVILARETKISDIERISKIIETEVFIHGALCTSLSGHCYFSSFIGGNSGNRGLCKQPCRKKYKYVVNGKTVKEGYLLSLADLCSQGDILTLKEMGVNSFKIEGRLRSEEYVASAVILYKNKLNGVNLSLDNVKTAFNRGDYTRLLGFGQEKSFISSDIQGHKGLFYGKISKVYKNSLVCNNLNNLSEGDAFKIIRNGIEVGNATIKNVNGKLTLIYHGFAKVGDSLHITKRQGLLNNLNLIKPLKEITVEVYAKVGEKLALSSLGETVFSLDVLPPSKSSSATKEDVISSLNKTDIYPFKVNVIFKNFDNNLFILKSLLNNLRVELYSKIFNRNISKIPYNIEKYENIYDSGICENYRAIITKNLNEDFLAYSDIIYAPTNYNDIETFNLNKRVWLYVPPFCSFEDLEIISKQLHRFYGIYGEGFWALEFAKQKGVKLFAGCGFNLFNSYSVKSIISCGVEKFAISKELSIKEISSISNNCFVLSEGAIEIMDLIYCPASKNCKNCLLSDNFTLIDEENRQFNVIRYKISECRFKIFNNAKLNLNLNFNVLVDNRVNPELITKGNYFKGIK